VQKQGLITKGSEVGRFRGSGDRIRKGSVWNRTDPNRNRASGPDFGSHGYC